MFLYTYPVSNKIHKISQLRKLHFSSSLQELSLSMNPVIDPLLNFQHLDSVELKEFRICMILCDKDECKTNEIGSLAKLKCEEIKEVGVDFLNEEVLSKLKK